MFDVKNKVALISGGASGIGLCCAKELLRNDLKAVVIADVSTQNEERCLKEIVDEFGLNRVAFIKTDVSSKEEFENAFKFTIEKFKNIDILINSAGILDDSIWEKQITVNINGTINGCLLAQEEYMPQYRSGAEGVVVNISSLATLYTRSPFPIYSATKHAVLGFGRYLGTEKQFQRSQVRFLTICPGAVNTPLFSTELLQKKTLGPFYNNLLTSLTFHLQAPENVAKAMVDIIVNGKNGSIWVVENDEPSYEIEMPPIENLRK